MYYECKVIRLQFISQFNVENMKTKMNQILRNLQKRLFTVHHFDKIMKETEDKTLSEFKNMKKIYNKIKSLQDI